MINFKHVMSALTRFLRSWTWPQFVFYVLTCLFLLAVAAHGLIVVKRQQAIIEKLDATVERLTHEP